MSFASTARPSIVVAAKRERERRPRARPRASSSRASARVDRASLSDSDDVERTRVGRSRAVDARASSTRRAMCRGIVGFVAVMCAAATERTEASGGDELEEEMEEVERAMRDVMSRNSGEQTFERRESLRGVDGVEPCAFEVSSLWKVSESDTKRDSTEWGTFVDPVNGEAVRNALVYAKKDFGAKSIVDLGKPEDVQVAKALGLDELDDSYRRADLLGAAKRVEKDSGRIFYDWELVASPPPKSCPSAVGCLYPEHIYLISATIVDGTLYVLSIDATPAQWRTTGNSVKRIRNSFIVGTS